MPKTRFAKCLAIINPHSTRSEQAIAQIQTLRSYFASDSFNIYELSKSDLASPAKLQKALSALSSNDLLVIAGGDGTIGMVVNLVYQSDSSSNQVTVLPLKAGNASDIAHMLQGKHIDDVDFIIANARRRKAYTVRVDVSGSKPVRALAYASFGAIAYTADKIDTIGRDRSKFINRWRPLVLLNEAMSGYRALLKAKRFTASLNNGPKRHYYDIVFVNGSRMAKLYRVHTKVTVPAYARLVVRHKHPALLMHLLKLSNSYWFRRTTARRQTLTLQSGTFAQIDGEVQKLAAGTTITISQETQPYYVLSCVS